jgi:hypothetical protein
MRRTPIIRPLALLALGIALQFAAPAQAEEAALPANKTILFVCPHDSVKSQIDRNRRGVVEVNYWSDVPPATKDDATARDVIVRHIDDLVPTLSVRPQPQETLRGVVTGIDERNDLIILRLAEGASSDFRVQDGLVFNAVHDGDQVEITVEDISGAKTIVGLRKQ